MKQTKKITISAVCIALGVLFMALGFFIEMLDLTAAALCSCLMALVFIEVGDKYAIAVWLGTSLLGLVFFTGSLVWVTYFLIFGIYPILKAYVERLKRPFWWPLKVAIFIIASIIIILIAELLLGIPFFGDTSGIPFFESHYDLFRAMVMVGLIGALCIYDVFINIPTERGANKHLRHKRLFAFSFLFLFILFAEDIHHALVFCRAVIAL